jgi:hypothetical protein
MTTVHSHLTVFKRTLRISATCLAVIATCAIAVSMASAQAQPVYLGSAACPTCAAVPLAQHPSKVVVGLDSEDLRIRWTHWGSGATTGHGRYVSASLNGSNGGDPGGSEPATLIASHPIQCGGRKVYSRLDSVGVRPNGSKFLVPEPFNKRGCDFVA